MIRLGALCVTAAILFTLASPTAAEICKYVDRNGDMHYTNAEPEKGWKKVSCGVGVARAGDGIAGMTFGVSPPSILRQCMDSNVGFGVGPSARARECTRQFCARPEYQAYIAAYAMNRAQSEKSQDEALTCITRAEQDRAGK
jgi:hypothetical protein